MGLVVNQDQSRGKLRSLTHEDLVALDRNRNEIILSRKTLSNADSSGHIFQSPTLITQLSPPSPSFPQGQDACPSISTHILQTLSRRFGLLTSRSFRCDLNCGNIDYVRPRDCRVRLVLSSPSLPTFPCSHNSVIMVFFSMIRMRGGVG